MDDHPRLWNVCVPGIPEPGEHDSPIVGWRLVGASGTRQFADPVRGTSEKLVGPCLSRPLTSPSRGAPCHPAPDFPGQGAKE